MTDKRTPDKVDQSPDGRQADIYHFGSASSKLDVGTSEEKIDSGDPIFGSPIQGGKAVFYNSDTSNAITIRMRASDYDSPGDYSSSPEDWYKVGDDITVPAASGGIPGQAVVTWGSVYRWIQFTKHAGASLTGKLWGTVTMNGHIDPDA